MMMLIDEESILELESVPLEIFFHTVVLVQSTCHDGTSQLMMWNTLFRQFKLNPSHEAIFLCCATQFDYDSFHDYMHNINFPMNSIISRRDFEHHCNDNLFVKELNRLIDMELYLKRIDDRARDLRNLTPMTIIIQDLGLFISVSSSTPVHEMHAITLRILLRLRKLAKLYGFTIMLHENNIKYSILFERLKEQYLDYKIVVSNDGSAVNCIVKDYSHNFLGFADTDLVSGLLRGLPIQVNDLFNIN